MKTLLLPTLALLLTALPTFARLGETKAQCEARYGTPVRTTAKGKPIYLKGGLEITILFWKDKAAYIYFAKAKPGAPDVDSTDPGWEKREPLSEAEMDVLLTANGSSSKWEKEDNPYEDIAWKRPDKSAYATYSEKSLFIRDAAAVDEMDEEQAKQEAEKLTAFARLGETIAECEKRCGMPLKASPPDEMVCHQAGLKVIIDFWKGKSARLVIFREDPDSSTPALSRAERNAVLAASSGSSKWRFDDDGDSNLMSWTRADKKAVAVYNMDEDLLIIIDQEYNDHMAKEEKKEKTKDLDGF